MCTSLSKTQRSAINISQENVATRLSCGFSHFAKFTGKGI